MLRLDNIDRVMISGVNGEELKLSSLPSSENDTNQEHNQWTGLRRGGEKLP